MSIPFKDLLLIIFTVGISFMNLFTYGEQWDEETASKYIRC